MLTVNLEWGKKFVMSILPKYMGQTGMNILTHDARKH